MPARTVIELERRGSTVTYALWADVPAALQGNYRNYGATSQYRLATNAELKAIREGSVLESVWTEDLANYGGDALLAMVQARAQQEYIQAQLQADSTVLYANYGRYMDAAGVVQPAPGLIPGPRPIAAGSLITGYWLTPLSAFGANKQHFVLCGRNNFPPEAAIAVRMLVVIPAATTVTGTVIELTVKRIKGLTTLPSGNDFAATLADTMDPLPPGVRAYNAPTTAPVGTEEIIQVAPWIAGDEVKATGLDGSTMAALGDFGGLMLFDARRLEPASPIIIRQGEALVVQQGSPAGAGNLRIFCVATLG